MAEQSSWTPAITPYAALLRLFTSGALSADELEVVFLRLYKNDPTRWSRDVYDVLDSFFADVDAYCADATLRSEVGGLDAVELTERARRTLARLRGISSSTGATGRGAG